MILSSAGIGDMMMQIPLILSLHNQGQSVTVLVYKKSYGQDVFGKLPFLDLIMVNNNLDLIQVCAKYRKSFDLLLVNHLFQSEKSMIAISQLSYKTIIINSSGINSSRYELLDPLSGIHDIEQNLTLLNNSRFDYPAYVKDFKSYFSDSSDKSTPIIIQLSAGNNIDIYKNWNIDKWIAVIRKIVFSTDKEVLLVGDQNEIKIGAEVENAIPELKNMIGMTTVSQLISLISKCDHFIGLDGGPLHIAAAFGKPTFTIWGPSNPRLYGYKQYDESKHFEFKLQLDCQPCSAWINPNVSRVTAPQNCPDYNCMGLVTADMVWEEYGNFINRLKGIDA